MSDLRRFSPEPHVAGGGNARTTAVAEWIREHYEELDHGAVVDARVILGETERSAISERAVAPL